MGEVILFVDVLKSNSGIHYCRICHEEESESCSSLEAPCACSGTAKFAHRACIQRWCDEKGNTTCEICLRKFEPGYTVSYKKPQPVDVAVSIRGSLEVPRREREVENPGLVGTAEERERIEAEYSECSSAVDRSASYCWTVALIFTLLLLERQLLDVITGGRKDYPFSLLTLFIIRASGILLPMYILIRIINSIQYSIRRQYQDWDDGTSNSDDQDNEEDDQEEQQLH